MISGKCIVNVEKVMSPSHISTTPTSAIAVDYRRPSAPDGHRLWEIASDSKVLDVTSSYAYVLWCNDFAATSIVAEIDSRPIGFVTGYRRPEDPTVLMVWQVAVDHDARGRGVAAGMLHRLFDRCAHDDGVVALHTTISPDNQASRRLFASVAAARGLQFRREKFFAAELFPDSHESEDLYRLRPPATSPTDPQPTPPNVR